MKKDEIDDEYVKEAVSAAEGSDKILLFMGLPNGWESEGFDRTHLRLPNNQTDLLEKLSKTGKPIIVLFFAGASIEMNWNVRADAIFAVYTAGQAMSPALLKLLFGEANPCGKLAETYPLKLEHTPCSLAYPQLEEAEYQEGIFVGYRYYDKKSMEVAYPFGHGLSYTTWEYSNLRINRQDIKDTDTLVVSVDIKNTGNMPGKEIVQLYTGAVDSRVVRPLRELKGFEKIFCYPGEQKTVTFTLNKRSFAYYNTDLKDWHVTSGHYVISVGASSRDIRIERQVSIESTVNVKKIYDAYVTIDELMSTSAGQKMMEQMMGQMMSGMPEELSEEEKARRLEDEDNQVDVPMDLAAMGNDMPLIKVADMTAGAFPYEAVYQVVDALNQQEYTMSRRGF